MEDSKGARYLPCDAFEVDTQWGKVQPKMAMPELCLMILNRADHCEQCAYVSVLYHTERTKRILNKRQDDERELLPW